MIIPRSFGGLGFSATAHSEVVTKLASRSVTTAVTVMVPNSLGPAELLLHYGTAAQQRVEIAEQHRRNVERGSRDALAHLIEPDAVLQCRL